MGKIRDFRKTTIDNIRENLTDSENDIGKFWEDDVVDWWTGLFSGNERLNSDLTNFDKYMERICELNDITATKLDQIVNDVHAAEATYSIQIKRDADNLDAVASRLSILVEEITKSDFEKNFNPINVTALLDTHKVNNPRNFNSLSPKDVISSLGDMTPEELALIDPSRLSESQRDLYYDHLYSLYGKTADPVERYHLLDALSHMTFEDARRLVFRQSGPYGGTQMIDAAASWNNPDFRTVLERYPDIMNEHCPKMSEEEIKKFLEGYASVGCGYMAAANGIFMDYLSKPDEFERTFGIPMFDANGNLNYQALALDIYCNVGDIGNGTFQDSNIEKYLRDKGVSTADTTHTGNWLFHALPTQTDFNNATANEQTLVMYIKPTVMYDANGVQEGSWEGKDAHAVVVTGVDAQGNLTVSSWGRQYTIKASEIDNYQDIYYETVDYE